MSEQTYVGAELELFAHARRWKQYWAGQVRPYIHGSVLEIGAGIGSNTKLLRNATHEQWVCLEPDPALVDAFHRRDGEFITATGVETRVGTLACLPSREKFDTLLYIDVLEHIADDRGEVLRAAEHLRDLGHLVVLSPAHQCLFSPFDQAIGHHRRYTASTLRQLTPAGLRVLRTFYLDSAGLLASLANRLLLRQGMPGPRQLAFWDNVLVPCSRALDPVTARQLGKSVVCVWRKVT